MLEMILDSSLSLRRSTKPSSRCRSRQMVYVVVMGPHAIKNKQIYISTNLDENQIKCMKSVLTHVTASIIRVHAIVTDTVAVHTCTVDVKTLK